MEAIDSDANGTIWFGTGSFNVPGEGVWRYDGQGFVKFNFTEMPQTKAARVNFLLVFYTTRKFTQLDNFSNDGKSYKMRYRYPRNKEGMQVYPSSCCGRV